MQWLYEQAVDIVAAHSSYLWSTTVAMAAQVLVRRLCGLKPREANLGLCLKIWRRIRFWATIIMKCWEA